MKITTLGTGNGNPTKSRFNQSTLLEIGGKGYLLDAGAPVAALLIRKDFDFNQLQAVFLSHFHEDHYGGLTGILKNRMRDLEPGQFLEIWMPQADSIEAFDRLMACQFRGNSRDRIHYLLIEPGGFFDDGTLRVTAMPTRHFQCDGVFYPSYGFLLEAEGKRVVYTGDLSADCSDFPVEVAREADCCLSELTHFTPESGQRQLLGIHPKRLIFSHINESLIPTLPILPYPYTVAQDGEEFFV